MSGHTMGLLRPPYAGVNYTALSHNWWSPMAAQGLYGTLQFLCGRFLKLAGVDVVSDGQAADA